MKRLFALTACAGLALGLMACDDDDPDSDTTTAGTGAVAASIPGANIVTVTATDYKFDGLPATAPAGTQFALQNNSDGEVHEMVMIRLPDEVTETVGQILALSEAEQDALVGDIAPSAVIVALPHEEGHAVEGDGTLTEPGRYAVMCFIPKGADPAVVEEAMSAPPGTGPPEQPDLGDGPPHIMEGMYAEIVIE